MSKIVDLELVYVDTIPEQLENGKLYISKMYHTAIHLCACGCGERTVTPLIGDPYGWNLTEKDGKVWLSPSIGNQQFDCRSHYWIKESQAVFD